MAFKKYVLAGVQTMRIGFFFISIGL